MAIGNFISLKLEGGVDLGTLFFGTESLWEQVECDGEKISGRVYKDAVILAIQDCYSDVTFAVNQNVRSS